MVAPGAVALALVACETATPYQPLTGSKGGFTEQRIEPDHYMVTFAGNAYTSRQKVENYLLYRAAELTVANGFDGFTVVQNNTDRQAKTQIRDSGLRPTGSLYEGWNPYWRYYGGRYGWRTWDPRYGSPYWGDNFDVTTVERYEAMAEITMFRGPRTDARSFDAHEVINRLRPSIQVPK